MSRPFAAAALPRLICPGFLFDVELFLSAKEHGLRHAELPVTFALRSEKTTVKIFQDIPVARYWLGRIAARRLARGYAPPAAK